MVRSFGLLRTLPIDRRSGSHGMALVFKLNHQLILLLMFGLHDIQSSFKVRLEALKPGNETGCSERCQY